MARAYTREYLPDVILLHIHLPDTDVIALCAELKASSLASNAKIIFVSADHANETELNAFEQGADDFVKEPINTSVLSPE
ncbi:MAG: response regulator [Glaciecola sp.]